MKKSDIPGMTKYGTVREALSSVKKDLEKNHGKALEDAKKGREEINKKTGSFQKAPDVREPTFTSPKFPDKIKP